VRIMACKILCALSLELKDRPLPGDCHVPVDPMLNMRLPGQFEARQFPVILLPAKNVFRPGADRLTFLKNGNVDLTKVDFVCEDVSRFFGSEGENDIFRNISTLSFAISRVAVSNNFLPIPSVSPVVDRANDLLRENEFRLCLFRLMISSLKNTTSKLKQRRWFKEDVLDLMRGLLPVEIVQVKRIEAKFMLKRANRSDDVTKRFVFSKRDPVFVSSDGKSVSRQSRTSEMENVYLRWYDTEAGSPINDDEIADILSGFEGRGCDDHPQWTVRDVIGGALVVCDISLNRSICFNNPGIADNKLFIERYKDKDRNVLYIAENVPSKNPQEGLVCLVQQGIAECCLEQPFCVDNDETTEHISIKRKELSVLQEMLRYPASEMDAILDLLDRREIDHLILVDTGEPGAQLSQEHVNTIESSQHHNVWEFYNNEVVAYLDNSAEVGVGVYRYALVVRPCHGDTTMTIVGTQEFIIKKTEVFKFPHEVAKMFRLKQARDENERCQIELDKFMVEVREVITI
jgi:hypothetical protein